MTMNFLDENPCLRAFMDEPICCAHSGTGFAGVCVCCFASGVFGPVRLVKADIILVLDYSEWAKVPPWFEGSSGLAKTRKL